jgi:glycosyltransferase involved in cell wall biosynthesis
MEQRMPHFSVVIAAFNAARWILATVSSALNQTYADYEIIVIGDGCTDATGDILISNFGSAVRWKNLDRNSGGQSYPNNEGIRLSRGTHIAYLGHDDIWSPRHLEQLASVIRTQNPDFAVSGAVYHGPPGSRYYQITGIFDDPRTAEKEFFPPSSFAHRRDVVDRIGFWRDPNQLRAPADCEFLMRAAGLGCSFASTKTITVHKFAAGHRHLSYRLPSGLEQERMLERLSAPGGEARVLEEIRKDIADGADNPPIRYVSFDDFAAGDLYRSNRRAKGLEKTPPIPVDKPRRLAVERFAAGLDWYEPEEHPLHGSFRWSGPNPNPLYLLNVRLTGGFLLRIHVLAFADNDVAPLLKLDVNDREMPFVRERDRAGTYVLTVARVAGPVDDGVILRFRLPYCVRLPNDPNHRRAGLALAGIDVVPLPEASVTTSKE